MVAASATQALHKYLMYKHAYIFCDWGGGGGRGGGEGVFGDRLPNKKNFRGKKVFAKHTLTSY